MAWLDGAIVPYQVVRAIRQDGEVDLAWRWTMTTTVLPPSTSWSMRDVRRVFAQLSAPDLRNLAGHWDGVFIGRPRLRRLTAAIATASPLRGWCGKQIGQSGDVHNLVRRGVPSRSRLAPWRGVAFRCSMASLP